MMKKWYSVRFKDHSDKVTDLLICSEKMIPVIEKDLVKRSGETLVVNQSILDQKLLFDIRNGFCLADRQIYEFDIDGLIIRMPATDVQPVYETVIARISKKDLLIEKYIFIPYYDFNLILFSNEFRKFKKQLKEVMKEATVIAQVEKRTIYDRVGNHKNIYID